MVDRRREQQTIRTVEALFVPRVAPGLDVAPHEMREVVDACDPARTLEAEHPLLEASLAASRLDDRRPLGVGDVARLERALNLVFPLVYPARRRDDQVGHCLRGHSMRGIDRQLWAADPPRMAIALDTLAYARRLREAGFSESQAEGQAEALAAAMTDTLATKQDLTELRSYVDAGFAATKQDLGELGVRMDARMDTGFLAAKRDVQELDIRMQAGFAAAKESMREMELRMDGRFAQMDSRFDAKLADLERRMTTRLGTVTVAAIAAVSALVRLL